MWHSWEGNKRIFKKKKKTTKDHSGISFSLRETVPNKPEKSITSSMLNEEVSNEYLCSVDLSTPSTSSLSNNEGNRQSLTSQNFKFTNKNHKHIRQLELPPRKMTIAYLFTLAIISTASEVVNLESVPVTPDFLELLNNVTRYNRFATPSQWEGEFNSKFKFHILKFYFRSPNISKSTNIHRRFIGIQRKNNGKLYRVWKMKHDAQMCRNWYNH